MTFLKSWKMRDLFHLVNSFIYSLDLVLDSFTDEDLLNFLDKPELIKLASSFKLRIKSSPKKSIIELLLKSAKSPSLLDFFSPSKTSSKSQLRKLYFLLSFQYLLF